MHHYTAYASQTIPAEAAAQPVWTYKVPQEAFSFPFLLHGLLAFAAYHLEYLDRGAQQRRYAVLANAHQTEAIHGMRNLLPELGPRNCHAMFATASLLALVTFAEKNSLDALVDIAVMLRGMNAIIHQTEELIQAGPLAPLFLSAPCPDPPVSLVALLVELKGSEFAHVVASSRVASAAAWELRETIEFCLGSSPHPVLRIVLLWPIRVESKFWDLVRDKNDWACKHVLKWYIKILEEAGSQWWFLEKWKKVDWISA